MFSAPALPAPGSGVSIRSSTSLERKNRERDNYKSFQITRLRISPFISPNISISIYSTYSISLSQTSGYLFCYKTLSVGIVIVWYQTQAEVLNFTFNISSRCIFRFSISCRASSQLQPITIQAFHRFKTHLNCQHHVIG